MIARSGTGRKGIVVAEKIGRGGGNGNRYSSRKENEEERERKEKGRGRSHGRKGMKGSER